MEGRGARYILGFCISVLTAVLLQCMEMQMGGVVLSVLVPISGSAWEQGKLCFWPYLVGALLIWRLGDGKDSRGGHCAVMVLMPLVLTALCWWLQPSPQAVAALWLGVLAGGIALYALVLRRRCPGGELVWYTLAILLGIAYLLATALPPQLGIFLDHTGVPTMAIPV